MTLHATISHYMSKSKPIIESDPIFRHNHASEGGNLHPKYEMSILKRICPLGNTVTAILLD